MSKALDTSAVFCIPIGNIETSLLFHNGIKSFLNLKENSYYHISAFSTVSIWISQYLVYQTMKSPLVKERSYVYIEIRIVSDGHYESEKNGSTFMGGQNRLPLNY